MPLPLRLTTLATHRSVLQLESGTFRLCFSLPTGGVGYRLRGFLDAAPARKGETPCVPEVAALCAQHFTAANGTQKDGLPFLRGRKFREESKTLNKVAAYLARPLPFVNSSGCCCKNCCSACFICLYRAFNKSRIGRCSISSTLSPSMIRAFRRNAASCLWSSS